MHYYFFIFLARLAFTSDKNIHCQFASINYLLICHWNPKKKFDLCIEKSLSDNILHKVNISAIYRSFLNQYTFIVVYSFYSLRWLFRFAVASVHCPWHPFINYPHTTIQFILRAWPKQTESSIWHLNSMRQRWWMEWGGGGKGG